MKKQPTPVETGHPHRRQAERLLARLAEEKKSGAAVARSPADTLRLLHELQVHQIELEMQNEELQQARNDIEAGLEKYSELYDFAPVGYLTLDPAGAIREANLMAATLLGVPRGELVKQRLATFMLPADRPFLAAFLLQVFAGTGPMECELKLRLRDQSPVSVRLRANRADSGQACRVTVTDITAHQKAEADRLILKKLESTGILAGGIAHDFNNLLTIILLNLELAGLVPDLDDRIKGHLQEARRAGLRAHEVTQQLITFAGGGQPVRKPTRLAEVIE